MRRLVVTWGENMPKFLGGAPPEERWASQLDPLAASM